MLNLLLGVILPFLGTTIGAMLVYFMKNKISVKVEKILLGFSGGVMIASSIWSLIIPSIELSNVGVWSFVPAVVGLIFGVIFLILLDKISFKMSEKSEKISASRKKKRMLFWAITIHNIPEGMAVGVALASAFFGNGAVSVTASLALAIGIAVQNIPEGAIVSMPMKSKSVSKTKAFGFGVLSGVVEPVFAIFTIALTRFVTPILPYMLSFASGAMIYVAIGELIPEANRDGSSKLATLSFIVGFLIMMTLDVVLG